MNLIDFIKNVVQLWSKKFQSKMLRNRGLLVKLNKGSIPNMNFFEATSLVTLPTLNANRTRNSFNLISILQKKRYFRQKFQTHRGDSTKTWKLTNNILGNSKKSSNSLTLAHGNSFITDETEIANLFNNYFINIGNNLINNIITNDIDPLSYMGERPINSFVFYDTNDYEVSRIIQKFKNKTSTINNIPISVIKKISPFISSLLAELFNESIEVGVFPSKLKLGRVIPLHKNGSTTSLKNYRPITTLSVFSKIFEKLVHVRMTSFINRFNIIKPNQFGFQKNKCTSDAILEFLENVYESFDDNNFYLAIFLDFSKAFDTISHDILLNKLDFLGFRGPINAWIRSFLTDRHQYVEVGGSVSCSLPVTLGVPQGSTLGPLFFILYINDMENILTDMGIIHFADDSTLHVKLPKSYNISNMINAELSAIDSWLQVNKLFLNINKTKYMIFSMKDKPPDMNILIGNTPIGRADVHKFLGVHIDDKINFSHHISTICSKLSRGIGILRRVKPLVPQDVLKQLYYAFIYSHFTYAITSYQSAYLNQTKKLSNLINKALKLILNVSSLNAAILKEKGFMDYEMTIEYFCCVNIYRVLMTDSHDFFRNKIVSFQIRHEHATRAANLELIDLPFYRLSKCKRSFVYRGLGFWNKLPINLRNIPNNVSSFKRQMKSYIFDKI